MKKRSPEKPRKKGRTDEPAETAKENPTAAETGSSPMAREIRATFANLVKDLHTVIEKFDDEEYLRLGKDSLPYQDVEKLVEVRDGFFAVKHNIPASDDPDALIADFNNAVKEAWRKLGEKWNKAVALFPELAESLRAEWGNIRIESGKSPYQSEMEELKQNLDEAQVFRTRLLEAIEITPADESVRAALVELDAAIETGKRRLSKSSAKAFRQLLVDIDVELSETIQKTDEAELIRSIADTNAARHIREYANSLADATGPLENLYPEDKPEELISLFSRNIAEARKKLKEKRTAAEKRHPRLKKEYPMNETYDQALAALLEIIKTRDELAETVKNAAPEKRSEGLSLLQQLDRQIERTEQALAAEYEAQQNHARAIDALRDEVRLAGTRELIQIREYLMENPGEMKDLQKLLAEEFPE
jgi:hypothetical protein